MRTYDIDEYDGDLPFALRASFAKSPAAYKSFTCLDEAERARIIDSARWAQSSCEIKALIRELEGRG